MLDPIYGSVYGIRVIRAVIDSNVIVAALKSSKGASHEVLRCADIGAFVPVVSVPLVAEYEDVVHRPELGIPLLPSQIDAILDRLCCIGINQQIHFLWRPYLKDPKDDMVFETALAARADFVITFNMRDFAPIMNFGIHPVLPGDFLMKL